MKFRCQCKSPRKGLLRNCENFADGSFAALYLILLKPGEPGYCKPGKPEGALKEAEKEEEEEEDDSQYPRPSVWGGWGFCDALCTQTNYQVDMTSSPVPSSGIEDNICLMAKWPHGYLEKNSVALPFPTNICVSGFLLEQRAAAEGDPAEVGQPRRVQRLLQPQRARAAGLVGHREEHVQTLHLPGARARVEGSLQVPLNNTFLSVIWFPSECTAKKNSRKKTRQGQNSKVL